MLRRRSALPLFEQFRATGIGVLTALCVLLLLPIRSMALSGSCFDRSRIEVLAESLDAGRFEVEKGAVERALGAPPLAGLEQRLQARGFSLGISAAVVVRVEADRVALVPIESEKRASVLGAALDVGEDAHAFLVLPLTKRRAPFLLESGVDLGRSRVARVSLGSLDGRVKTLRPENGSVAEGRFESLLGDYPQASPECTWCVVNECLLGGDWCSWAMTLVVNCWDCWTGVECTDCTIAIAQAISCRLIECAACDEECADVLPPPPPISLVFVPSGTFIMGDGVAWCGKDEHQVTLTHDFWIGQYEVTNQEYLDLVQWAYDRGYVTATSASVRDNLDGSTKELVDLDSYYCEIAFSDGVFSLRNAGHGLNGDHPMKEVSWHGAAAYCDWLSLSEGFPRAYNHSHWKCGPEGNPYAATGYRLPTDAEWEYVAQWDDERIHPWGNETTTCSLANFRDSNTGPCVGWTSPVGRYPAGAQPNLTDLVYDLSGNVEEWANDLWTCKLGTSPQTDPPGPVGTYHRIVRGGGWTDSASCLRNCNRLDRDPNYSGSATGFRPARSD